MSTQSAASSILGRMAIDLYTTAVLGIAGAVNLRMTHADQIVFEPQPPEVCFGFGGQSAIVSVQLRRILALLAAPLSRKREA